MLKLLHILFGCLLIFSAGATRLYGDIIIHEDIKAENVTIKIIGEEFSYLFYTYDKNYSIELPPGYYTLNAELHSSYDELYTFSNEINLSKDTRIDIIFEPTKNQFPYTFFLIIVFFIFVVLFLFYQKYHEDQWRYYQQFQKQQEQNSFEKGDTHLELLPLNKEEPKPKEEKSKMKKLPKKGISQESLASFEVEFENEEETVKPKRSELPSDLRKILLELKLNKNRLTQKKLKSLMKCSLTKLKNMLSELEHFGYITKHKQGNEVIIVLTNEKIRSPKKKKRK